VGSGARRSLSAQSLWGSLASIPGLTVVVASTPADAYGLMTTALAHDGPVIFMEPKLLSEECLEFLGRGGRDTVTFDVPADGGRGVVPDPPHAIPFGSAAVRREGADLTIASVAVGVHRALAAAAILERSGELAAVCLEAGLSPRFDRVCVEDTLPYARHLEKAALPNVERIIRAARELVNA